MEYSMDNYNRLLDLLDDRLRKMLNKVAFVELSKDIPFGNKTGIEKGILLPILSEYLVHGINSSEYLESINFEDITVSMIYVIGCDSHFKHSHLYIEILKRANNNITAYLIGKALELASSKRYMDALIYYKALDRISDNKRHARYNLACTLKELAEVSMTRHNTNEYNLYYNLSYFEFLRLDVEYPDFFQVKYQLGFYFLTENKYEEALDNWKKAYENEPDENIKYDILNLMNSVHDNIYFEQGRDLVVDGDVLEGLKKLIPLIQKHDSWSEAKYYTALGYRKLSNYKKAEVLLSELLKSGENFSEIYNELGLCYFNLGNIESANMNFQIAVTQKPDNPGYLCNLALTNHNLGRTADAKRMIYEAYNINPTDEITKQCKAWIDNLSGQFL